VSNADIRFDRLEEGLARQDQTLDRILGILQDHGGRLGEIKTDVREVRRDLSGLQKDFREHLLWHLGRAS